MSWSIGMALNVRKRNAYDLWGRDAELIGDLAGAALVRT
jgi:hypothetical protein